MTPRWTCFFGLDEGLEVRVDDERCPGAIAEITEGELTPLPRHGHHEDWTTALHPTTIALLQVIYVFALEVTQALLTPGEVLALCCLDVGHERGEVLDPRVVPVVCLVCDICSSRLPVEKVDGVGVEFCGDVDRRACFPFVVPEGEEVDAGLEFVLDGGDLIVGDGVVDLVETLFGEEAFVSEWALMIFGALVKGRQHSICKAAVVSILYVDDRMFLLEEGRELPELETCEREVFDYLEICLQDLMQHQPREISIEADVSLTNCVDERVQLFVQHHGTCDDPLSAVEADRVLIVMILCEVGVRHIDRHPEVDAVFVVHHVEESG